MNPLDFAFWNIFNPWLCLGVGYLLFVVVVLLSRRRPPDPRLCLKCSYDLTGNTTGRCPECGEPLRPAH